MTPATENGPESDLMGLLRRLTEPGPIPFSQYMELALYHPQFGYYTRQGAPRRSGAQGDFLTAPTTHRFFGTALGRFAAGWADARSLASFHILEIGGGTGELAQSLLDEAGDLVSSYTFVERSPTHRDEASKLLHRTQNPAPVEILSDLPRQMPGPTLLVANEVMDNLPVSLLHLTPRQAWGEVHVSWTANGIQETVEAPTPEVREFHERYLATRDEMAGLEAPVLYPAPVTACRFLEDAAQIAGLQAMLLLDYGATTRDLVGSSSTRGTVTTHTQQVRDADPYRSPGQQDITYTVDMEALSWALAAAGWRLWGPTTQGRFLLELGAAEEAVQHAHNVESERAANDLLLLKELFIPGGMGERFKVLLAEHPDAVSPRTPPGFGAGPLAL